MGIKPNVLSIVVPKVTFRKDGIKTVLFCPVTSVSTQYIVPPPYFDVLAGYVVWRRKQKVYNLKGAWTQKMVRQRGCL